MKTNTFETLGVMFDNKTSWKKMKPLPATSRSGAQVSGYFVLKYSDEGKEKHFKEKLIQSIKNTGLLSAPLQHRHQIWLYSVMAVFLKVQQTGATTWTLYTISV